MLFRGAFITECTLTSFMTTNGIKTTKKISGFLEWAAQCGLLESDLAAQEGAGVVGREERESWGREEAHTGSTFMVGGLGLRWGQLGWELFRPFITNRE